MRFPRVFALVCACLCALVCAQSFAQSPALNLEKLQKLTSERAKLLAVLKGFNRPTKESIYETQLTNVSALTLHGPVYLTIADISAPGVQVKNRTGTTTSGLPYFVMSSADIAASAAVTLPLFFSNPLNVRFTFTMAAYATPGGSQPPPPPLTMQITHPGTLITVGSTPLRVDGTVSEASATVTVNGAPVSAAGGVFHADVELTEGHNAIIARATNAKGEEATATISVSLDLTPPYVTIESPREGQVLTSPVVSVSGLINDIVRGTVSDGQANVTVNGHPASVANRSYLAQDIALQEGPNTIRVEGADQVGNVGVAEVHVTYQVPTQSFIQIASGQAQTAQIREVLPQSLAVRLVTASGQPVANKPVVFRVTEGDGQVGVGGPDQDIAVLVNSDGNGVASTRLRLGARAGSGNNHVTAKAVGFEGEAVFVASATPKPGNKVSVNSGNNQRGAARQPLPLPFVIVVTDDGANVIEGASVEFAVTAGSGTFQNGQTHITATTDSDGRASAKLTLGAELGLDVQRVNATLTGTQLFAGFTASALQSGPPGATSISGVVLDNQDHALPNVTLRVEGTTREAKTDDQGRFKITEAPVGPVHLIADGSTTTTPGEWPTLPYNLVTVAGADNPLPAPVYLVKLDTTHAVTVGDKDQEITLPEVPGFKLTVKAGSVKFPNSDRVGQISVTPVNVSKIPMAPPNGMQPQFIVTIQPTGTRFDPPAPLQLPNVDGHPPGAQVEMYSFDHDLEEFVAIGLGTVSADGTVIKSNPGIGVIKAGWHCGSQPGGSGCAGDAPLCNRIDENCSIVPDDNDPRLPALRSAALGSSARLDEDDGPVPNDRPHDCQMPVACDEGGVVLGPNDADLPEDLCKTCQNGAIVDAGPGETKLTSVTLLAEGQPEKWRLLGDAGATFRFRVTVDAQRCTQFQYIWNFGDGTGDIRGDKTMSHTYTSPGSRTVQVNVGCQQCLGNTLFVKSAQATTVALRVKHETFAHTPGDRQRILLGVGEGVFLSVEPAVDLNWTADNGARLASPTGTTVFYTAPSVTSLSQVRISKAPMLDQSEAVAFAVRAPGLVSMTKNQDIPLPNGVTQGAFMATDVRFFPTNVSFYNVEVLEIPGPATNRTGHFTTGDRDHRPNPNWIGIQESNFWLAMDVIGFGAIQPTITLGDHPKVEWDAGGFDWVIPWHYRVKGDTTEHLIQNVLQHHELFSDGTARITKAGACVSKPPVGVPVTHPCPDPPPIP